MRKILFFVLVMVFFSPLNVFAENESILADPLKRNLIFVEGTSEIIIPVNNFEIKFGFDIQKGSFNEASQESNRIFDAIEKEIKTLGLSDVEVIKGWDLLRQAKISFGSKGKTISTKVTIRVKNCPQGKLHTMIAQVIDKALAIDSAIVLENINVFIDDKTEQEKKQEVTENALKKLNSNATRIANSLEKKITSPKRVYITSGESLADKLEEKEALYDYSSMQKCITIRKSFKVDAEIVDYMKISATVTGIFEIN
ncbi:MAG: SIMPL domain-containing protein [Candidatus Omnitrophota bacterium]